MPPSRIHQKKVESPGRSSIPFSFSPLMNIQEGKGWPPDWRPFGTWWNREKQKIFRLRLRFRNLSLNLNLRRYALF
jgi:hypothetical protein